MTPLINLSCCLHDIIFYLHWTYFATLSFGGTVYVGAQARFRLNVSTRSLSCVRLESNSISCSYYSVATCPLAGMSPFLCTWLLQNSPSVHCVNMCCYNLFNKQAAGQQLNRIKAGRKAKLRKIVWGRVKSENSQANR